MGSREEIDATIELSSKLEYSNNSHAISSADNLKLASISDGDIPKSLLLLTIRLQKKSFLKNLDSQRDLHHTRTIRYVDFYSFTGTGIFFQLQGDSSQDKSELSDEDLANAADASDDSQIKADNAIGNMLHKEQQDIAKNSLEVAESGQHLKEKDETGLRKIWTGMSGESKGERLQIEDGSGEQDLQSPVMMLRR